MRRKQVSTIQNKLIVKNYLEINGHSTRKKILNELDLSVRDIRYALRILEKEKIIKKVSNLRDMRSSFFVIIKVGV